MKCAYSVSKAGSEKAGGYAHTSAWRARRALRRRWRLNSRVSGSSSRASGPDPQGRGDDPQPSGLDPRVAEATRDLPGSIRGVAEAIRKLPHPARRVAERTRKAFGLPASVPGPALLFFEGGFACWVPAPRDRGSLSARPPGRAVGRPRFHGPPNPYAGPTSCRRNRRRTGRPVAAARPRRDSSPTPRCRRPRRPRAPDLRTPVRYGSPP